MDSLDDHSCNLTLQDSRIPTGRLPGMSVEDFWGSQHCSWSLVPSLVSIKTCEVRCELELQERSHHRRLVLGFLGFVLSRSGYLLLFCGNEGIFRGETAIGQCGRTYIVFTCSSTLIENSLLRSLSVRNLPQSMYTHKSSHCIQLYIINCIICGAGILAPKEIRFQ